MRYWTYTGSTEPTFITLSEKEIIQQHYSYWYQKMCRMYDQDLVDATFSFQDCIDDWIIDNRAWESNE